ncbi:metal ABC transporter permease [Salinicoccus jeotgali]|uniref:Metal ABC transporter permease n=1 Tax=Salinicoccus jeotgali TaxID=381634 RepID=A0ABP7E586_9STAP
MSFLNDLLFYDYLQKALITSIMVGIISGVIGSFIVLRGMSLMGDAISHAVLPGIAISYMLGISYFYGAVVAGVIAAVGIGGISQNSRIKTDASIGIVFSTALALGIILITKAQSATDLTQILFGNVLHVRTSDMWITAGVSLLVIIIIVVFYKELLIATFDETMARVYGLNTRFIHYGLMVLLTLVAVASLQTVGVILVVSLLITPASTAYLLTNRLSIMIVLSSIFGASAAVVGIYYSYMHDLPSGPIIAIASAILFVLVLIFSPRQGVLWPKLRKMKKS